MLAAPAPAAAVTRLAPPKGEVLLTVSGRISVTNQDDTARLDRDQLLGWGVDELRTTTPFTDGVSIFTGVLGSRLLDGLGAQGSSIRTRALNDYTIEIPIAELRQEGVTVHPRVERDAPLPRPVAQRAVGDDGARVEVLEVDRPLGGRRGHRVEGDDLGAALRDARVGGVEGTLRGAYQQPNDQGRDHKLPQRTKLLLHRDSPSMTPSGAETPGSWSKITRTCSAGTAAGSTAWKKASCRPRSFRRASAAT